MTTSPYNTAFQSLVDSLNPAQRRAVEQTEGPVLVIAGPGTGKTHLLSARIGKILLDTDAKPQNILCLTFTDAGAHAMRQRLLGMIGPEAHRVPIFTFHAFCNRIIQENLELFGRSDLEPLTDLERIEIVRQILEKIPPEHPLRAGKKSVFQYERQLRDLFASMKKEGWTPGHVIRSADEFLAGLPANPDYIYQRNNQYGKKGEPKAAKVKDAHQKMDLLRAAADLYPKYQHALERAGLYEYEDMILWVLRAFDQHENLLRNYQERYQYFLVDEYQDTNGAQNRLLQRLLDYWPNPNVLIVGDDDQSIYEFQGARLKNLLEFYHIHKAGLQTIVLDINYRSTQDILDAAARVIERNDLRAIHALTEEGLTKVLHAHTTETAAPVLRVYDNRLSEITHIALQIEALLQTGTPASDIAVLYARHKQAVVLMQLLGKKGIPFETKRPANILDLPLIRQFRELLRYLHDELIRPFSGEHRLFRLLHAPWFDLRAIDLARLAAHLAPIAETTSGTPAGKIRNVLADLPQLQSLQLSDSDKLFAVAQKIEQWISDIPNLSLPGLIERLYTQSGLLRYTLNQTDKAWYLQVLYTFQEFVNTQAGRHPRLALDRLLALLDSMDDNDLPLLVQQSVRAGEGVQLVTAHSAKGLEFEHVFLFDCTEDYWEPSARGGNSRFALPDTLTLSGEEDAVEARRRLFYVAMTRAERHLSISYSRTDTNGKALRQVSFVQETGLPETPTQVDPATMLETQAQLLLEPTRPVVTLPEPALIDDLLADFTLSVTALNRFLRCPLAFYYQDVLRIPETVSEAATFGHAMHEALRQFFSRMKADKNQAFPDADTLIHLFAASLENRRGFFSTHAYNQRLALGRNLLRQYHATQVPYWRRRAIVERRIDRVELEGVPMTGVLDKIEWLDNGTIRIVDYKTGVPDVKKLSPPSDTQPHGGDYWRQLAFYKILLERSKIYGESVSSGVIAWLEPDKKGNIPTSEIKFAPEEMHFMEQLIHDTYARITRREFTEGCGAEDCIWCTMHRDQEMPAYLSNGEEDLDDG
jgi:DNA helicase-2/ATP-dependent DNA helicase PcrA